MDDRAGRHLQSDVPTARRPGQRHVRDATRRSVFESGRWYKGELVGEWVSKGFSQTQRETDKDTDEDTYL